MDEKLTVNQTKAKSEAFQKWNNNEYWLKQSRDDSTLFNRNHQHSIFRKKLQPLTETDEDWLRDTNGHRIVQSRSNYPSIDVFSAQSWDTIDSSDWLQHIVPLIQTYRFSPNHCRVSDFGFGISEHVKHKTKDGRSLWNTMIHRGNGVWGFDYYLKMDSPLFDRFWTSETLRGPTSPTMFKQYESDVLHELTNVIDPMPLCRIIFDYMFYFSISFS